MERRENLIGVYGGTFDPIHLGHVHLIQSLLKTGLFKKILIVPAKQNPLKQTCSQVPNKLRLKMLQASAQEIGDPRVEIWDGELKRQGLSFMKDTLEELTKQNLGELALIIGNEVFKDFHQWKEPQTILNLANLAIVQRTGESVNVEEVLKNCEATYGAKISHWIKTFEINALPYSATQIRESLAKTWKTGDLSQTPQGIQRSVWLLIKENQLYAVN